MIFPGTAAQFYAFALIGSVVASPVNPRLETRASKIIIGYRTVDNVCVLEPR